VRNFVQNIDKGTVEKKITDCENSNTGLILRTRTVGKNGWGFAYVHIFGMCRIIMIWKMPCNADSSAGERNMGQRAMVHLCMYWV
jgi:hypothetical protein